MKSKVVLFVKANSLKAKIRMFVIPELDFVSHSLFGLLRSGFKSDYLHHTVAGSTGHCFRGI